MAGMTGIFRIWQKNPKENVIATANMRTWR
jgi:hypothetical protein